MATAPTESAEPMESEGAPSFHRITRLGIALPILLSIAVFGLVTYLTFDLSAYQTIGRRVNLWLVAAAIATVVARVFFGGWRLDYLADGRLGLAGGLRIQLIWDFLATVTPSTVGGGPFVPVVIARERAIPLGQATSVMLFAMLLDQINFLITIPIILICMHFMDVIPSVLGSVGYWSILLFFSGFMIWVLAFAYGTLFKPQVLTKVVESVFRVRFLQRFRAGALRVMRDFQNQARLLRSRRSGFYVKGFALTVVPWMCRYALMVFVAWSIYPALDRVLAFVRAVALNLSSIALPFPGGAGGVEVLYAAFYGPPILPNPLIAPTLLVWRLLSYYLFIVVGSYFAFRHIKRRPTPA